MPNEPDHQIKTKKEDANFARVAPRTENGRGNAVYTGSELASSDESIAQEEHGSQADDDTLSGNLRHSESHRERIGTNAAILKT